MALFNKLEKPVFLKEESDAQDYIKRLKELQNKATGELKKRIEQEIKFTSLGEAGEKNIAFELKNSGIPMYILHDIHLATGDLSAQIDYIVVTRKLTFVIECKNLYGNIEIDNQGNFIRNYEFNRKRFREGIYSPITQNQRHLEVIKQIRKEMKSNALTKMLFGKYFDDGYKSIVVLANPKTILNAKYASKEVKEKVIRADQLIQYIKDACKKSKNMDNSDKYIKQHAESFLDLHTPKQSDYARKYEEIIQNQDECAVPLVHDQNVYVKETQDIAEVIPNKTDEKELVQKLKAFRLEKAREENIKPYFIFNDKQMLDVIEKMPDSPESLLQVSGFGDVKVKKYGESILEILGKFK